MADAFLSAFENFCGLVVEQPDIAPLFFGVANERLLEFELRIWPLGHHFPHLIFYYLCEEEIRIFAVLHSHMDLNEAL